MGVARPAAGRPRQQAPLLLLAQSLAAEVPVARGPQLACSASGQLAVAAAGSQLLLLDSLTATPQPSPISLLLDCPASITAVAVSSGSSSEQHDQQWAVALAGRTAHFVPARSKGTCRPACGIDIPTGTEAWQACAWHPSRTVCTLLSPQQLHLASPIPDGGSASSSSNPTGTSSAASILATIAPRTQASSSVGSAVAGRCCLAWLDAPGRSGCWGQLAVSWGLQLELLVFGSDWKVLERRQLLPGVPGVVCGLAAAGIGRLLVTTERPVGQWLTQQQQRQEEGQDAAVLLHGLQHAAQRQLPSLLLPAAGGGCGGGSGSGPLLEPAAALASTADTAVADAAAAVGGTLDLASGGSGGGSNAMLSTGAAAGPTIPSMFMLPPELPTPQLALLQQQGSRVPAGQAGQAALLWLHTSDACSGNTSSSCGSPSQQGPTSSAAEAEVTVVQLKSVCDLLQVQGSLAVLAGSRGPPAVAACLIGPNGLAAPPPQQPEAGVLPLPAGIAEDCTVTLRGLAVAPLAAAEVVSEAGTEQLLQVWALLAAAPPAAAAPFMSAALAGSGATSRRQQLWLCCYRLAVPTGDGTVRSPHGAPGALQPPPAAALPPVKAVVQLQQAMRALRQDVTARLDGMDACLAQLLQALG